MNVSTVSVQEHDGHRVHAAACAGTHSLCHQEGRQADQGQRHVLLKNGRGFVGEWQREGGTG